MIFIGFERNSVVSCYRAWVGSFCTVKSNHESVSVDQDKARSQKREEPKRQGRRECKKWGSSKL
jgi:hypothetical protein